MSEESLRPDRRQPVDISMDGQRLRAMLDEVGIDLTDIDRSNELLRSAGADPSQIRALDSRLQMAQAVDWQIDVVVTVRY